MKRIIYNFLIIFIFLYTNNPKADELLIYADNISYDSEENIIAKGNAKIIKDGEIITSNLIIYNSKNKSFLLPSEFTYKDSLNNYYLGSSGVFDENIKNGEIDNVKILLSDGNPVEFGEVLAIID